MKRIFSIVLALITVSCSVAQPAAIPTTSATIVPITETSTSPSDFPSPTVIATETNTPSPTPENKYAIDLNKLNNFPSSYEELLANPGKYQEAPDPFTDITAFNKWWADLKIALGDPDALIPNLDASVGIGGGDNTMRFFFDDLKALDTSNTKTFFFRSGDTVYPVILFVPKASGFDVPVGVFAAIIPPSAIQGYDGDRTLENLVNGRPPIMIVGPTAESEIPWPDEVLQLVGQGLNWNTDYSKFYIGVAQVKTYQP